MLNVKRATGLWVLAMMWSCGDNAAPSVIPPLGGSSGASGMKLGGVATAGGPAASPSDMDVVKIDRAHLAQLDSPDPLDYSDPALWVCRPGIDPNPCYGDHGELDATEVLADGSTQLLRHHRATDPKFDCFYVYPTVFLTGDGGNQKDLSNVDNVLDALMAQGARMSRICEVYAPLYRQVSISPNLVVPPAGAAGMGATGAAGSGTTPGGGPLAGPGFMFALADVRAAFKYYLDHFNRGRKFVLMGHSQGSGMLIGTVRADVDPNPELRAQMISALLIGGGVTVTAGQASGGSFQNIPVCTHPDQINCVIAYSSFDTKGPDAMSLFGASQDGQDTACTNPGPLAGNLGPYKGSYFQLNIRNPLFKPSVAPTVGADKGTAFLMYRDVFSGQCVSKNGAHYLEITSSIVDASDPRGLPPYSSSPGFGLHVYDWHFAIDDLIDVVSQQAAVALP